MKYKSTSDSVLETGNSNQVPKNRIGFLIWIVLLLLSAISNLSFATTFTCQTPTAGGVFTISLKSLTDNCGPISVNIPAGSTAAQKAALIAAKINTSCVGVFTATSSGADVTVTNAAHPGSSVYFKFGPDDTGEKDKIEDDLQPGWWGKLWGETAPLFTCSASASGLSFDGINGGKVYIGTSTYVATVMTIPGESPFAILSDARNQLLSHGLSNVDLYLVSPGIWGLSFHVLPGESFVQFGNDDSGAICTFEMFEPPTPQINQLNFNYNGTLSTHSDWGALDLTFMGSPDLLYLNLSVDTGFVIENMPVQTLGDIGSLQTQRFWFRIGPNGIPVTSVSYGVTLTPTLQGRPALLNTTPVVQTQVNIQSGTSAGGTGDTHPAPATKQIGGAPVQPPEKNTEFPNQEAGDGECVPTGISNSLQYLNNKNELGMKPGDISISSLKAGCGWTPVNGCPSPAWVENKKAFVKNEKLPITTRKLDGPENIKNIGAEIAAGQDVEMDIGFLDDPDASHCVCVTGWVDLGNGKYKITITHDSDQGNPGGCFSESATFDSNTGVWSGALAAYSNDFFFVVECPTAKLKQVTPPVNPPGSGYKDKTNGGSSYLNGNYEVTNIMISNINATNPFPPLGNTVFTTYTGTISFNYSSDFGSTFTHFSSPVSVVQRTTHALDSAGISYYPIELTGITQLGSNPVMIRESPTLSSTGLTTIHSLPGGLFMIDSFFDVFTELSFNGGATWMPSTSGSSLLEVITQSVTLNQLNFNYNGTITNFSDWGALDLTFPGSADVQYLNATVNGVWVIQNMPVQSLDQSGMLQTQRFWFPVGPNGIQVTSAMFGYTLTSGIAGSPAYTEMTEVVQEQVIIFSGDLVGGGGDNHPPPAVIQVGGAIVQPAVQNRGFPNQEAGVNECVPVGISNSLNYLNTKNGLGMNPASIGIPGLKGGTGWGPGGCPRPGWVQNKKAYVKNKKLPITTRKLGGPANIKNIGAEIAAGQDVEMDIKWNGPGAHCVCVTSWCDLGNGKYKITITHDSKQGQPGGTVSESATYDKNTGTWTGALVNGTNDFFFVVECPTIRINQALPTIPSGSSNKYKPHSGSQYNSGQYQVENLQLMNFSQTIPPPPVGGTQFVSYVCDASLDLSANFGVLFTHWTGFANVLERVTRQPDSIATMFFETEMISLTFSGSPLPGGFMIRESPTIPSTGKETMLTVPGDGYMIDSFFDVFTELSIDGGISWIPEDDPTSPGSTLLEVEGPEIPGVREVQNVDVGSGESNCYDATQTLFIAGGGTTYHVGTGGSVTMIAGQNILFEPGSVVDPGGYLHAYITTTGDYCSSLKSAVVIIPPPADNETGPVQDVTSNSLFKIYPNPTNGNFTLELVSGDGKSPINVEIYSMRGEKVFTKVLDGSKSHELTLFGNPVGIYFVRVITNDTAETVKIIKH